MQTEIQKMQLRQQPGMKEVFFHGGSVVVPKEEESIYINVLADKYFNGYRVYVEGGQVKWSAPQDSTGTDLKTLRMMLKDQNRKIFALRGELYDF